MKGKRLSHEDILKLPNNTKVLIVENNKAKIHTLKFDDSLLYKLYDENYDYFTQHNVIKNFLQVYKYIPDKQIDSQKNKIDYSKNYDGIEILQLIRDDILKEGDIIDYVHFFNSSHPAVMSMSVTANKSLIFSEWKTEVPCWYMTFSKDNHNYCRIIKPLLTFDEARKSGKKFRHKSWNEYSYSFDVMSRLASSGQDSKSINKILDEKAWEVEE